MNSEIAKFLLASLIERIDRNAIGSVSTAEREALGIALSALQANSSTAQPIEPPTTPDSSLQPTRVRDTIPSSGTPVGNEQHSIAPINVPDIALVTDSLERNEVDDSDVLLCLDFGTAMSKAFAQSDDGQPFELELGAEAGGEGYAVPSSVFITDQGKVLFGFEAVDASQELEDSNRCQGQANFPQGGKSNFPTRLRLSFVVE